MFLSIILIVLQYLSGFLLTGYVDRQSRFGSFERIISAFVLGMAVSAFILLLLLLMTGSWQYSIYGLVLILGAGSLVLARQIYRGLSTAGFFKGHLSKKKQFFAKPDYFLILLILIYLGVLLGVLWIRQDGLISSVFPAWGDTAYHLNMIGVLRYSDPFVLMHPVLGGESLSYPFLVNLLTALYLNAGLGLLLSWNLPLVVFGTCFVLIVYMTGKRLFSGSRFQAAALVALVLFGSGMGFLWFIEDVGDGFAEGGIGTAVALIADLPRNYTHFDATDSEDSLLRGVNIEWIVPAVSFFSHQRSFVAGAALGFLLLLGMYLNRKSPDLWRWGIVWGMTPLFHAHTFIAVSVVILFWFLLNIDNWQNWILAGIVAALMVLPQMLLLVPDSIFGDESSSFISLSAGWVACVNEGSWLSCTPKIEVFESVLIWFLWFWSANFGLVFWLWLAYIFYFVFKNIGVHERTGQSGYMFVIPGIVLFILPNLVLFQPWEFDNNKILLYWWFFASISAIYLISVFLQHSKTHTPVLVMVIFLSTFSGFIDVANRFMSVKTSYHTYYTHNEAEAAGWIKDNTGTDSVFLTGNNPGQFIPMLTGRGIYLGYSGWLWSQGKRVQMNERYIKASRFLSTGKLDEICEDSVKYVLWDERLTDAYPRARFENVLQSADIVYTSKNNGKVLSIMELRCKN